MHLGNAALTPECAAISWAIAGSGIMFSAISLLRHRVAGAQLAAAGALGTAVFAAQAVNVPVLPFASAHLVGGVLLAWVAGPALGAVTMAIVLALQAVAMGDGGLMAYGANVINMALVPAGLVWFVRRPNASTRRMPTLPLAGATAGLAVLAAAVLIVGQVALGRSAEQLANLGHFAWAMIWIHALIGLAEGLVTAGLIWALQADKPIGQVRLSRPALMGSVIAAAMLVLIALPNASGMPDGYEASAERTGMGVVLAEQGQSIAEVGRVNLAIHDLQHSIVTSVTNLVPGEVLLVGLLSLLCGTLVLGVGQLARRRTVAPA